MKLTLIVPTRVVIDDLTNSVTPERAKEIAKGAVRNARHDVSIERDKTTSKWAQVESAAEGEPEILERPL